MVGDGIVSLGIDIGARRRNGLQLILADAPIDDFLDAGLRIEGPLAIRALGDGERERPDLVAEC